MTSKTRIPAEHILRKYDVRLAGKTEWFLPSDLQNGAQVEVNGLPQLHGRFVARATNGLGLIVNEYDQPFIVHTGSLNLPTLF